jgi:hypothetical protein
MRQAINRLFGRKNQADGASRDPAAGSSRSERADGHEHQHTIEDNSDNAVRRQLVQMMLRDGLRKHGIPAGWIECRILVVHSRSRGPGLHVKLVMRHWDMLLLTYAHAFEQQLMTAIREFEPQASHWLHGFSWELDVGDSCPYQDMPDPSIWHDSPAPTGGATMPRPVKKSPAPQAATPPVALAATAAVAAVAAVPTPAVPAGAAPEPHDEESDVRRDLERMFAIRDANIEQAFTEPAPLDFQNTEPADRS